MLCAVATSRACCLQNESPRRHSARSFVLDDLFMLSSVGKKRCHCAQSPKQKNTSWSRSNASETVGFELPRLSRYAILPGSSRRGGIGRHARFRSWWPRGHGGSNPSGGTTSVADSFRAIHANEPFSV